VKKHLIYPIKIVLQKMECYLFYVYFYRIVIVNNKKKISIIIEDINQNIKGSVIKNEELNNKTHIIENEQLYKILSTKNGYYREYIYQDNFTIGHLSNIDFLRPEAKKSLFINNAGGKSEYSEALSIHYFQEKYNATDIIPEMEIEYWINYKMVDFLCTIQDYRIGVSVTRAMKYPNPDTYTKEDGFKLLHKKLYGMIVARNGVTDRHSFHKSILHVWCQTDKIAEILKSVYQSLDINDYGLDIQGIVILILTVCNSESIYKNNYVRI